MDNEITFKPEKNAFIYYKFFISLIILFFIFGIISLVLFFTNTNSLILIIPISLFFIINIFNFAYLNVRYKKEIYIIKDNRFIAKKGGFFSDHQTELIIKNITQVWMNKPFIEHKFFNTGNILIKAAGSSETEIYFSSISKINQIYEKIWYQMEKNGFVLSRNKLIQKEKPSTLAIIFELSKRFFGMVFSFFFILLFALPATISFFMDYLLLVIPVLLFIALIISVNLILKFLDLKRRVYYLYEDMIEYYDGFLTRNYSYIPIENLSDSEITQTFFDKIFDLYDIKISSQGSSNEIYFTNIKNGKLFKNNLDELISITPSLINKKEKTVKSSEKTNLTVDDKDKKDKKEKSSSKKLGDDFTFITKMDAKRTFLPFGFFIICFFILSFIILGLVSIIGDISFFKLLIGALFGGFVFLFWLIFVFFIFIIKSIIEVFCTTFKINKKSIEHDFNFLNSKNYEFTLEKITKITIKESIIDKFFNTISIEFNSIGSTGNIYFKNIKKTNELMNGLLQKFELLDKKIVNEYKVNYTFKNLIFKNLYNWIFFIFLILTLSVVSIFINPLILIPSFILILLLIPIIHFYNKYYYRTARLKIFDDFVLYTRGLLISKTYYSKYNNIKDLESIKFPFTENIGSLRFNIAGESVIQTNQNQKSIISNSFTMNYLKDTHTVHDLIDEKLHYNHNVKNNSEKLFENNILKTKPTPKNSVFFICLISVIFLPLLLFLPIILFFLILIIKKISFIIQDERLIKYSGVLFKSKKTIIYSKLDHITKSQGFVNKLFNNGNVNIYTTGSSIVEMQIFAIKDYNGFYSIVEKKY